MLLPLAFGACAARSAVPTALAAELAESPPAAEARLWLAGDRIVAAAIPLGPGWLTPTVQTTLRAVAPDGETTFTAREYGPRGTGLRIEKHYTEPAHDRSVLIGEDGAVLERAHTWPIPEVPQDVLATALRTGPKITTAWIVSGPTAEEYWDLVVQDRDGQTIVVRIGLDGRELARSRRGRARIDG
jgi:hypothetical protein